MAGRNAVFLDLQGTLGGEGTDDIRDFAFYTFSADAIKLINNAGLLTIILTNQSHIAEGHFTLDFFNERVNELKDELSINGAYLDGVYCCPHSEKGNCSCAKPKPGLLQNAVNDFNIDVSNSYIIGDTGVSDIVLAHSSGCKGILVMTGLGESSLGEYRYTWKDVEPDYIAENVYGAVKWIISDLT